MNPTIDVTKGRYGFGHEWTLMFEYGGKRHERWLGQDVKVASRVCGCSARDMALHVRTEFGLDGCYMDRDDVRECLAALIVEALGGLERIVNAQPWDVCAE